MNDQPYAVIIKDEGLFLRIEVEGVREFRRCAALMTFVRDAARTHGKSRVLLDEHAFTEPNSDLERFQLGELAGREWQGLKVAIIDPVEALDEFAQTTATNRGATVNIVRDEASAIAWLLAPPG